MQVGLNRMNQKYDYDQNMVVKDEVYRPLKVAGLLFVLSSLAVGLPTALLRFRLPLKANVRPIT